MYIDVPFIAPVAVDHVGDKCAGRPLISMRPDRRSTLASICVLGSRICSIGGRSTSLPCTHAQSRRINVYPSQCNDRKRIEIRARTFSQPNGPKNTRKSTRTKNMNSIVVICNGRNAAFELALAFVTCVRGARWIIQPGRKSRLAADGRLIRLVPWHYMEL